MNPALTQCADGGPPHCIAFNGAKAIASGRLFEVVQKVKALLEIDPNISVLIFDYADSRLIEIDFRGAIADIEARMITTFQYSLEDRLADSKDDLQASKSRLHNQKNYLKDSAD